MKKCNPLGIGILFVLVPLGAMAGEPQNNSTQATKTSGLYEVEYSLEPMSNTIPPLHEFKVIVRDLKTKEILANPDLRFEMKALMMGGSMEIGTERAIEEMKKMGTADNPESVEKKGITTSLNFSYDKVADKVNFKLNIYKGAEVVFVQSAAIRWTDLKK